MNWTPCSEWRDLPIGTWLVKIDDNKDPYHIAEVTSPGGNKLIIAGGIFYRERKPVLAYTDFEPYNN